MPNEAEQLFTGMFTFPSVLEPDTRQFGMVGCTSDPDGSNGLVTVFLHLGESGVVHEVEGSSLKLTIAEPEMRNLLPVVELALQRLQTLRSAQKSAPPPR